MAKSTAQRSTSKGDQPAQPTSLSPTSMLAFSRGADNDVLCLSRTVACARDGPPVPKTGSHMGRLLALGDIHGCLAALDAVLQAADLDRDDTLVVLGDVIGYGRESAGVIDRLMQLEDECELICIRGNHEEMLLGALESEQLRTQWLNVGGIETLNSYEFCAKIDVIPPAHIEFVRGFRDYYKQGPFVFTHAGYDAERPFDDQPAHALRWNLLEEPWPEPHTSGKTAVVGHTEQHDGEVLDLGHIVCLDTGCRSYGWLTLWDAQTRQTWQASKWGALREQPDSAEIQQLQKAREILTAASP